MSFSDKLKRLANQRAAEAAAAQVREDEENQRQQAHKKRLEDAQRHLDRISAEQIRPLINEIGEVYLHGSGEIQVLHSEVPSQDEANLATSVRLDWDQSSNLGVYQNYASGRRITVVTSTTEHIVMAGTCAIMGRASLDDPDWRQKIQDALLEALTSDSSRWSSSWVNNLD